MMTVDPVLDACRAVSPDYDHLTAGAQAGIRGMVVTVLNAATPAIAAEARRAELDRVFADQLDPARP